MIHRFGASVLVCGMLTATMSRAGAQGRPAGHSADAASSQSAVQGGLSDDLRKELAELRAQLAALELKHAEEREQDQRRIAELEAVVRQLQEPGMEAERRKVMARQILELQEEMRREGLLRPTSRAGAATRPAPGEQDELDVVLESMRAEAAPEAEPRGFAESLGRAFQSFNPDISVIGDFVGHYSSREGGELDDEFLFRHLELGFSGNVDPYARGDIFVGLHPHEGDWHVDLEEAYLTYLGLPWGLQPRVGRFKASFGKANPQHLHALPWVEYPFIIRNYFGEEGLSGDGVGVAWLIPNPWNKYIELTYECVNNDSSLFAGEETDDFVHLVHLKNFFDLSPASTFEGGFSFATAPNDEGHGGNRTTVEGLDLTYKWRPPEKGLYKSFVWQTEFLAAQADLIGGQESTWGMYSAADYQFARRWSVGARYDYSQMPYSSSLHEHGLSAYLTFLQSEYLYWRLGYQYTDRNFRVEGNRQEHEIFLQCNFGLGPHRAHKY
jgi:ribosomal protein L29